MVKVIITIGRQFGSGGREVGRKVASSLGIPFYDKELLAIAAKESGLSAQFLEDYDEKPTNSLLYSIVVGQSHMLMHGNGRISVEQMASKAQRDAVMSVASKGSCVIVGRCADYALHDYQNCLHIFIHGDEKCKAKRIMERYDDINTEQKALDMMNKKDKQRQSYYNYYSSKKWGRVDSYDLSINSSRLGIDGTVKLIAQFVEDFETR